MIRRNFLTSHVQIIILVWFGVHFLQRFLDQPMIIATTVYVVLFFLKHKNCEIYRGKGLQFSSWFLTRISHLLLISLYQVSNKFLTSLQEFTSTNFMKSHVSSYLVPNMTMTSCDSSYHHTYNNSLTNSVASLTKSLMCL